MVGLEPTRLAPHDPKSCSSANFDTSPHKPKDYTIKMIVNAKPAPMSVRLWLERVAVGLVAVISLLAPLVIGLLFYLGLTDSIVINAGNPVNEMRLWMIREARGATGLGLSISTPTLSKAASQCAQTHVTFLKWDRTVRFETTDVFCRCYTLQGNQYIDAGASCP